MCPGVDMIGFHSEGELSMDVVYAYVLMRPSHQKCGSMVPVKPGLTWESYCIYIYITVLELEAYTSSFQINNILLGTLSQSMCI